MQQLYLNNFFYKNPTTGEFVPIAGIAGESAYEIAVRLGFDGTEAQFLESLKGEDGKILASPHLIENMTIHLGSELYDHSNTTDVTLGDGWTKTEDGYTHSANTSGELAIPISGATVGETYLVQFDTDYSADEFIKVGIGTGYRVLCYNSKTHIELPLTAHDNTMLYVSLHKNGVSKSFNLSNISIRHIQETGDEHSLEVNTVLSDNHTKNYGFWNVMLGLNAMDASATTRTIAIGNYALRYLQGGHRLVAIGTYAGNRLIGGENNIMIGADAMMEVEHADNNIAIGHWAMEKAVNPDTNIAIGQMALRSTTGKNNVAIGKEAGVYDTGTNNVLVGHNAGYRNRTGSGNTSVGGAAYGGNGGSYNTNIGYQSQYETGCENTIVLGANAKATKSKQMMLGSSAITEVVFCGNKKIIFNADGTVTWETLT